MTRGAGWSRPPLWLAGLTLALLIWLFGFYLPLFFGSFPTPIDSLDFSYYYAGARIGLENGWSHIYDLTLQGRLFRQLHPGDAFDWRRYFISPPPVAWLVAPFSALPLAPAFWTFTGLSAVAFAVAGWVAAPGRGLARLALFAAAACVYPVLIAIQTGQVTTLVAAACLFGWWLAGHGRKVAAGLVLAALVLKPQVAILVVPGLLLAGERRLVAAWTLAAALLVVLSLLSLGSGGLSQLESALRIEQGKPANLAWTLAWLLGTGPLTAFAQVACGLLALAAAWRQRASLELVIVAGMVGTILAAPYHNPSDFAILAPAAWLYIRAGMPAWQWAWLAVGLLGTYLAAGFGPALLLIFTIGWLALLLAAAPARQSATERAAVPSGERARAS